MSALSTSSSSSACRYLTYSRLPCFVIDWPPLANYKSELLYVGWQPKVASISWPSFPFPDLFHSNWTQKRQDKKHLSCVNFLLGMFLFFWKWISAILSPSGPHLTFRGLPFPGSHMAGHWTMPGWFLHRSGIHLGRSGRFDNSSGSSTSTNVAMHGQAPGTRGNCTVSWKSGASRKVLLVGWGCFLG